MKALKIILVKLICVLTLAVMTAMMLNSCDVETVGTDTKEQESESTSDNDDITDDVTDNEQLRYTATADGTAYTVKNIRKTYTDGAADDVFEVVVPSSYKGKPVVGIEPEAFKGNKTLKKVVFSDTVKVIGEEAFWKCESLAEVVFSDSITEIEDSAFFECKSLTAVSFGENSALSKIGYNAFGFCSSLKDVKLPNGLTEIGMEAFNSCRKIESIVIPESVTMIDDKAFYSCEIKSVVASAYGCKFVSNTSLKSAVITSGNAVDDYTFARCESLESVTMPDTVTEIGKSAFSRCSHLQDIQISKNVTSIGEEAFYGCRAIENIVLPEGLVHIGDRAFSGCSKLTELGLPEGLTGIGSKIVVDCTRLEKINVPKGFLLLRDDLFIGCEALTEITVSDDDPNYKTIDGVVYSKDGKTLVRCPIAKAYECFTVPDGVEKIGSYAFSECKNIREVVIPEGVVNIGKCAFIHCDGLYQVTMPISIVRIEESAFCYCNSFEKILYQGNSEQWLGVLKKENWNLACINLFIVCTDKTVRQ